MNTSGSPSGVKPIAGLTGIIRDYGIIQAKPTAELIKIIKDLIYNNAGTGNTKERDNIIKKVEQDFASCDARIDQYIRNSSKDLSNLIKVFNEIAKKIENSRERVSISRDALKQCKILLQSKRDDVRRLWLEWCEQKFYYENIAKLKQLYQASENVRIFCNQKKYLEAAQLIAESSQMLEKEFHEIAGLNEIKRQIEEERIKLERYLYLELTDQLYSVVTKSVLETGNILPSREASFKRRFRHHNISRTAQDDSSQLNDQIKQSLTSEATIEKIVKAASKLNTPESNINIIEKMITDVNKNITNQLILMINSTSTHVLESNLIDNSKFNQSFRYNRQSVENNPKLLAQLIDLTFEQFKMSAKNYRLFIEFSSKINGSKYQSSVIWQSIQNVLILLLEEYLDIRQLSSGYSSNSNDLDKMDINSFFVRKRLINLTFGDTGSSQAAQSNAQTLSNNPSLDSHASSHIFAFKNSSHAISITKYNREMNNENLFDEETYSQNGDELAMNKNFEQRTFKILVCQPDHRNITTIFSLMEHIIKDVADEISY